MEGGQSKEREEVGGKFVFSCNVCIYIEQMFESGISKSNIWLIQLAELMCGETQFFNLPTTAQTVN